MLQLRGRILLNLLVVATASFGASYAISHMTLLPSFAALEHDQAVRNLERGRAALANEVGFVDSFVGDWSGWDDTYKFITDHNAEYSKSNLESNAFRPDSFDFLSFVDEHGNEVWRGGQLGEEKLDVEELPHGKWPLDHVLLRTHDPAVGSKGILHTSHGPLLLACRPVTDSERKAKPNGWIIMGRFLTAQRIEKLATQTGLQLTVAPLADLAADRRAALENEAGASIAPIDDDHLAGTARIAGLTGARDDLAISIQLPRNIMSRGRETLTYTLASNVLALGLLFGVLLLLLQRSVVRPLRQLRDHTLAIRASDDLTRRCDIVRSDEIGTLASEFDRMVERLAASQAQMLNHARAGGMAEVARGVLHDVGNALQGVTTSAGLLRQRLHARAVDDLGRVSAMLAEHTADLERWLTADPKGKQVPGFLPLLAADLRTAHGAMRDELTQLTAGLDHIQHLVDLQHATAAQHGALEKVALRGLVDEAVRLGSIHGDGVRVDCDFADVTLRTEKHKVLAILINLLRNAVHSVTKVAPERRTIRIVAQTDGDRIRITVADQGIGIPRGDLARIFQGGFSTRPQSEGRGLHSCANSATELGGTLVAESEGPDRGANFVLTLPLEPATAGATA